MNKTNKNRIFKLAKIVSPFGIRGFVFAKLLNPEFFSLVGISEFKNSCFVEASFGALTLPDFKNPSKIIGLKEHKKGVIAQIKGCETRSGAENFVGRLVFSDHLLQNSLYLLETVGFVAYDLHKKLGNIKSVYHNNAHGILVLHDLEIPFVDKFIEKIDWKNKKVKMKLTKDLYEI